MLTITYYLTRYYIYFGNSVDFISEKFYADCIFTVIGRKYLQYISVQTEFITHKINIVSLVLHINEFCKNINEVQAKELGISETQECYGFVDEKDKVMQLAAMQGYVTRKEVEDALQVKTTKAYMLLQELCDAGRLAPIGVGRSRKYISR